MTDPTLPTLIPLGPGPAYLDKGIWLPQLFMESARAGQMIIEGKTFVRCRLEGPAVLLVLGGCAFDGCNMGDADGETRNLLLAPVGASKVTGVIPFRNCRFEACDFERVGYTGAPDFIRQFHGAVTPTASSSPE